jgi:hypothetical protein
VHNDSGNPPLLFAIRKDGTTLATYRLSVPNVDWEDIAIDNQGRLYLGDIGNNNTMLPLRAVYRFDEPDPTQAPRDPKPIRLQVATASYYVFPADGRFDAEGLVVAGNGERVILIAKTFDGRDAELYEIPFDPPAPLLKPARPRRTGRLPGFKEPATGANLSRDGRLLAVCSLTATRVYQSPSASERMDAQQPRSVKETSAPWRLLSEVHYSSWAVEGIGWDGPDLILAGEDRTLRRIPESTWNRAAKRAAPPVSQPQRPGSQRPSPSSSFSPSRPTRRKPG